MMRILVGVMFALVLSQGGQAAAAPGDPEDFKPGRFAERCVSVIQTEPTPTWHIAGVISEWNAAQSIIRFSNVAEPGCGVVVIRMFDQKTYVNPPGFAWTSFPDYINGEWLNGEVGVTWLYHSAEIMLPRVTMKGNKCWAKTIVAHELGHAMALPHSKSSKSVLSQTYKAETYCGHVFPVDVRTLTAIYS
jgi:predicted Zn-dependent protease